MAYLCEQWTNSDFRITCEPSRLQREGDFFVLAGRIEILDKPRLRNCYFSHLMVRLIVHYIDGQSPREQDVFHITDREFRFGESCEFRFEGEYADNLDLGCFELEVLSSAEKTKPDQPVSVSDELKLEAVSDFQDRISLNGKSALIQLGDVILVDQPTPKNIFSIFEASVRFVTRSKYHHALLYDHGWQAWHAVEPHAAHADLRKLYFGDNDLVLTWLRPLNPFTGAEAVEKDTLPAMEFAQGVIERKTAYDMWANLAFILRADGRHFSTEMFGFLMKKTTWLSRLILRFFSRLLRRKSRKYSKYNRMEDPHKYHCSEFVAAAWHKVPTGGKVLKKSRGQTPMWRNRFRFVDNMTNCTYVSPADIFDSSYTKTICTLKIENGKLRLLTR